MPNDVSGTNGVAAVVNLQANGQILSNPHPFPPGFTGGITTAIGSTNFADLAFDFHLTPQIMLTGIAFAALLGGVGGLFPAGTASRKEILTALREA